MDRIARTKHNLDVEKLDTLDRNYFGQGNQPQDLHVDIATEVVQKTDQQILVRELCVDRSTAQVQYLPLSDMDDRQLIQYTLPWSDCCIYAHFEIF
jgi:hypothetical protein